MISPSTCEEDGILFKNMFSDIITNIVFLERIYYRKNIKYDIFKMNNC